ncbi:Aste57867_11441 [Aphanomyces stellatus]|uniref:Aste57867_11441 protein n=1 Tax=Aphanomyces stellatus TaxID=120398 RepID=A0A485KTI9_9STRA|nr:hypothetical protein As57867_011399 [Aphanomyces stellatus]VFT88302.1 Aste57867_11441 [Aphanomyces stellatus]
MSLISMLMRKQDAKTLDLVAQELAALPRGDYMWMNILLLQVYQALIQESNKVTRTSTVHLIESLLAVLDKALAICHIETIQRTEGQCFKLLQCLFNLMPKVDKSASVGALLTDDGRLSILKSIHALCTSPSPLPFLSSSVPFVAYMVSALILCAQTDSNRMCRVHALEALTSIVAAVDDAHVLTQVFPGLTSALFQLVLGDYKLGSKLPAQALLCLTQATVLVLQDTRCSDLVTAPNLSDLDFLAPRIPSSVLSPSAPRSSSSDFPNLLRSPDWLSTSQTNMDVLVTRVCAHCRHHAKLRVRTALLHFCRALLLHCRLSLAPSFFPAYETALALGQDPIASIQATAAATLAHLNAEMTPSEQVLLHSYASTRFLDHVDTLAKKCAVELDLEAEAISMLQLCIGYLAAAPVQLVLETQVDRLLRGWCRILKVDAVDAQVLAHVTYDQGSVAYYRKRFVHFRTDDAIHMAAAVVRLMGAAGSILVFVDATLQDLNRSDPTRPVVESLFLLNHFVLGAAHIDLPLSTHPARRRLDIHVAGYLLDGLLRLPYWSHDAGNDDECQSLLLEIVGSVAQALGAQFSPLLMHVLYVVVEQLGRPSKLVQQAAVATLQRMAWACAYDSVPSLLHDNMDYVVDLLCNRLAELEAYPHTPFVVEALLKQAGSTPLPLLEEAVKAVVRTVDAHVTTQHTIGLLRVMKVIVANEPNPSHGVQSPLPSKVDAFVHEMNALFHVDTGDDDDEIPSTDTGATESAEASPLADQVKGAMPIEFDPAAPQSSTSKGHQGMTKLVQDIVVRCTYFTAAPDVTTSCLAWQVLQEALAVLQLDVLRPLVHRIWPMLTKRLAALVATAEKYKPMLLAAVQCFASLASLCGDFIGDKFIETIWPQFKAILVRFPPSASTLARAELDVSPVALATDTPASSSQPPPSSSIRLHALVDQIHVAMLVCLERMCSATDVVSSIARDVASSCQRFLASSSPPPLQDHARTLFLALARLNPDELFPRLAYMASYAPPPPPSARFPAYSPHAIRNTVVAESVGPPHAYARNATRLLAVLQSVR